MRGASREVRGGALRAILAAATTTVIAGMAPMRPDYPLTAVSASQVTLTDQFWAPKLETNRRVTIPHIMRENVYENGSHELYNCGHLYEAAAHFPSMGNERTSVWLKQATAAAAARSR